MLSPYSEAFAFAAYENNRDKWVKQFKWQDAHPGQNLPTNKENSQLHEAKWSSNKMGQHRGGWTKDGVDTYYAYCDTVQDQRAEENAKKKEQKALDLMREANNKNARSAAEEVSSRKRKRSGSPEAPPPPPEVEEPEVIDD